ncbi:hypothetical protein U1Q18_008082 [Sarracenia purpurea var. burkii]
MQKHKRKKQAQWISNINIVVRGRGILTNSVTRPEPGESILSELGYLRPNEQTHQNFPQLAIFGSELQKKGENQAVTRKSGEELSIDPQIYGFSQGNYKPPLHKGYARQGSPDLTELNPNPKNHGILTTTQEFDQQKDQIVPQHQNRRIENSKISHRENTDFTAESTDKRVRRRKEGRKAYLFWKVWKISKTWVSSPTPKSQPRLLKSLHPSCDQIFQ